MLKKESIKTWRKIYLFHASLNVLVHLGEPSSHHRHLISSPLMICGSYLASRVIAFNVNFACLDCGCSATRFLKFWESKWRFFCKCCAAAVQKFNIFLGSFVASRLFSSFNNTSVSSPTSISFNSSWYVESLTFKTARSFAFLFLISPVLMDLHNIFSSISFKCLNSKWTNSAICWKSLKNLWKLDQ